MNRTFNSNGYCDPRLQCVDEGGLFVGGKNAIGGK